jgi:adenosylmethionine-8-amino-7-oxononanoate aminotransferase
VSDVRVKGAIGVLELTLDPAQLRALRPALIAQGVWLRPLDQALYLMPPFTISDAELDQLFAAIGTVLG